MISKTTTFLLVGGVAGLLSASFLMLQSSSVDIAQAGSQQFWEEYIATHGAQEAYATFSETIQSEAFGLQHEKAHIFGGALYAQEGMQGLVVCDSQFDYGCFHEFLGKAIAENGIDSLPDLNDTCITILGDNAGYCQHGIGHGIQSYYGYKEKDLIDSLALCDALPENDPVGGCAGGVFMEYNLRTMLGDERVIRDDTSMLAPCDSLTGWQQKSCYFWQPQWWYEQFINEGDISIEELFVELGRRCDIVSDKDLRNFCYQGIGNLMQARGGDNDPVFCDIVSEKQENRALCWDFVQ